MKSVSNRHTLSVIAHTMGQSSQQGEFGKLVHHLGLGELNLEKQSEQNKMVKSGMSD